jgi:hypothetical protein
MYLMMEVHESQVDKAGEPYYLHPMRVASGFVGKRYWRERIVALLHDVFEDSELSVYADLDDEDGYDNDIRNALDAISRRNGERYDDYIARVDRNSLARRVKLHDLEDNLSYGRRNAIPKPQRERYRFAMDYLRGNV